MAKSDEIAAATIPRGPIQLIISFSLVFRLEPIDDAHTDNGRATNITIASSTKPAKPTLNKLASSTRAARMINNTDTNKMVSDSLNSKIVSRGNFGQLASATPRTVTVNKPDSCSKWLEIENRSSTKAKVKTLRKTQESYGGALKTPITTRPLSPWPLPILQFWQTVRYYWLRRLK